MSNRQSKAFKTGMRGTAWLAILVGAGLLIGCASSGQLPNNTVQVDVSGSGTISVNRRVTELPMLAQRLRSMGARSDTSVIVAIPGNAPPNTLTAVTEHLASAGFSKILFSKPKTASSSTSRAK